jgi:hypothetical protein
VSAKSATSTRGGILGGIGRARLPSAFALIVLVSTRAGSWWNFDVYHAIGTDVSRIIKYHLDVRTKGPKQRELE